MTLTELKQIAASCKSETEFAQNPDVRRVYWKCLGKAGLWEHVTSANHPTCCGRCGADYSIHHRRWEDADGNPSPTCPTTDHIPGSLADANEQLRVKYDASTNGDREKSLIIFSHNTLRQVFTSFAAALGGVTIE